MQIDRYVCMYVNANAKIIIIIRNLFYNGNEDSIQGPNLARRGNKNFNKNILGSLQEVRYT